MGQARRLRQRCWLVCVCSALLTSTAYGDPPISSEAQALLAGACYGCHNATVSSLAIPALAGQTYEQLMQSLLAFRDGSRESTLMMRISKGYRVDELQALAQHFAAQPTAPESNP